MYSRRSVFRWVLPPCLKLQSCFARGVGQRFNAAVVEESATIEYHLADALGLGAFGNEFSHLFCPGEIATAFHGGVLFTRGRRGESRTLPVVNHLCIDMFQ